MHVLETTFMLLLHCIVCSTLLTAASPIELGEIRTRLNLVSGTAYAITDRSLEIRNFVYDGLAPDVYFWGDRGDVATPHGSILLDHTGCGEYPLQQSAGMSVQVELPSGTKLDDFGYFAVWSRAFELELGGFRINKDISSDLPAGDTNIQCKAPSSKPEQPTPIEPFPVPKDMNCDMLLSDKFQVRWKVQGTRIVLELVGRINDNQYMGFGPSGSEDKTEMIGSDPAIAFLDINGGFTAVDYFITSKSECENAKGVCPDVAYDGGVSNVYDVSGSRVNDLMRIRYTRSLNLSSSNTDKSISVEKEKFTYISWAIGPINSSSGLVLPSYHETTMTPPGDDVAIAFGRHVTDTCPKIYDLPVNESGESIVKPWNRETIMAQEGEAITARIGPSGGSKGLPGLSGRDGWPIAWYMNDNLAGTIGVERGKTYTFNVFGGDDPGNEGYYHPLYITSDPDGGRGMKTEEAKQNETIYAGKGDPPTEGVTGSLCMFNSTRETEFSALRYERYFATLDTSCKNDPTITAGAGILTWTVTASTPDIVYYQSFSQQFMGWKVLVFESGQVNQTDLDNVNSGGNLLAEQNTSLCSVMFKGSSRTFSGCREDLAGGFKVYWTVNEPNEFIETVFSGKPNNGGYVAWSWGRQNMVPGNAVVAFQQPDTGAATILEYSLQGKSSSSVQVVKTEDISKEEADIASDGTVLGYFVRPLGQDVKNGRTDAIWAIGPVVQSRTTLREHSKYFAGSIDLSAASSANDTTGGLDKIMIAHGILMGVTWIMFVPLAVFVMRFLKKHNPVTFHVHRGILLSSYAVIVVAFILGLSHGDHHEKAHLSIGSVAVALATFQVISGIFRPDKESDKRPTFYFAHSWTGRCANVLGIINVYGGLRIAKGWKWLFVLVSIILISYAVLNLIFGVFLSKQFPPKENRVASTGTVGKDSHMTIGSSK